MWNRLLTCSPGRPVSPLKPGWPGCPGSPWKRGEGFQFPNKNTTEKKSNILFVICKVTFITLVSILLSATIWGNKMMKRKTKEKTISSDWEHTSITSCLMGERSFFIIFVTTNASFKHGWTDDKLSEMTIKICLLVLPEVQVFPLRRRQQVRKRSTKNKNS